MPNFVSILHEAGAAMSIGLPPGVVNPKMAVRSDNGKRLAEG
jgi:hypothetical protein